MSALLFAANSVADAEQKPVLSVLVPFFRDDPTPILLACREASRRLGGRVEFVLHDDGSADMVLLNKITRTMAGLASPVFLYISPNHQGRSATRNALVATARAHHVLFLDADMIPDHDAFLDHWLEAASQPETAIAFGGFSVAQTQRASATDLHYFLSRRADCRSAADRMRDPAQFTTTSNLLVRRDVLEAFPFDGDFRGWGWEDVDWALRVAEAHPILHIDNPATHAGLDSVPTLLRKYREAGPNYRRLALKHPDAVRRFRSWQAAQRLRAIPGHRAARPILALLARTRIAPLLLRHAALKLFRTSIYAEHLA
jgi:glycosyltransferase involved in cell wall biosynthesis